MKKLIFLLAVLLLIAGLIVFLNSQFSNTTFKENPTRVARTVGISFYEEFLTPEELQTEKVIKLLIRHNIKVYIAAQQGRLQTLTPVLQEYQKEGIQFALWPLLKKENGYWAQEENLEKFSQYLDRIFTLAKENGIEIKEIVVDLEPKQLLELAKENGKGGWKILKFLKFLGWAGKTARENLDEKRFKKSKVLLKRIIRKIHSHKAKVTATVSSFVLEDGNSTVAQDFFEAPIFGLNWDQVDFQCYNSNIVNWSSLSPQDLSRVTFDLAGRAEHIDKNKGLSFSIGILSPKGYSPEQVIADIETLRAADINEVNIYSFEGLLEFPQPERELDKILRSLKVHSLGSPFSDFRVPKITLGSLLFIVLRKLGWFLLRIYQVLIG